MIKHITGTTLFYFIHSLLSIAGVSEVTLVSALDAIGNEIGWVASEVSEAKITHLLVNKK